MARILGLRTYRVISALVLREMSTTYGRSAGGYLWAIAEPVAGVVLLTAVFSLVLRSPPIGTSFALFYATGVIPFTMYMTISGKTSQAVKFSKQLLVYPRVTFFDAVVARFILNGLTQVLVGCILMTYLLATSDTRMVLDFNAMGLAVLLSLLLGLGIGSLNCLLFSIVPTWARFWAILNRPLFIISGIFFIFDNVPDAFAKYLWFNPLIHVVGLMRQGVYPTYVGEYISVTYVCIVSGVSGVIGLFFLRRYHKKILNEL